MKLNLQKIGNIAVVALETEIINNHKFKANIRPILENYKNLIFDMRQVKLIDTYGCAALLTCLRKLNKAGGELKLFGVCKPTRTLFELVRIHRIVEIFNTKEEAVNSYEIVFASN
ncbi:STAS domain-containing protein [Desulfococcaceae bacterium HSG9]|nr:STAS domain-containing protein [Desulfococcaceae bacterium HSG9]